MCTTAVLAFGHCIATVCCGKDLFITAAVAPPQLVIIADVRLMPQLMAVEADIYHKPVSCNYQDTAVVHYSSWQTWFLQNESGRFYCRPKAFALTMAWWLLDRLCSKISLRSPSSIPSISLMVTVDSLICVHRV